MIKLNNPQDESRADASPAPQPEAPEAQALALLLDDNLMSAMRVQPQLQRAGFRVHSARAVPSLDALGGETPQLVLINLGSRGMNGVEQIGVCRERFPDSRVLGFCGHLEVEIRRAAKAASIDKILTNDQALSDLENSL